MAQLTTEQKIEIWRDFMSQNQDELSPNMSNKEDLKTALSAIDQWVDNNKENLVAALPANARPANNGLTASQIAYAMVLIVSKRYEVGA